MLKKKLHKATFIEGKAYVQKENAYLWGMHGNSYDRKG